MASRGMGFLQPLFGGFFRIAPLAQTIDDGRRFWGWRTMADGNRRRAVV